MPANVHVVGPGPGGASAVIDEKAVEREREHENRPPSLGRTPPNINIAPGQRGVQNVQNVER